MRLSGIAIALAALAISSAASLCAASSQEEKQALAPTGKIRGAFLANNPIHATKDPSGEFKGPAIDLGRELARRIAVPFEGVAYPSYPALVAGAKSGEWDIIFFGILPERMKDIDFSAPYAQIEGSYLVAKDSPISTISEVDRPGVRVAVLEKGAADTLLSVALKHATLIRTPTVNAAVEMFRSGNAEAVAALKTFLFPASEKVPGSRVLDGRTYVEDIGIGVPKGRDVSAAYVRNFVNEAKANGLVKAVVEGAAQRGFVVAP
jgi:polar amino acid transport system substrate-binding protein